MHIFLLCWAARRVTFVLFHSKRGWGTNVNTLCSRAGKIEPVRHSQLQPQKCRTCNATSAMTQKTTRAPLLPTELGATKTSKTCEHCGVAALDSSLACTTSSCLPSKAQSRQHQTLHQGSLIHVSRGKAGSPLSAVLQSQTCKGSICQARLHKKGLRYNT